MKVLFEYGNWEPISDNLRLRGLLEDIWANRYRTQFELEEDSEEQSFYQPFLQFDGNLVRANNYVGFIQNGESLIEIYPKVFRATPSADKALMLRHIFYWFNYCRKWRFPFTQASLDSKDIDRFPELIIYLIASQFAEVISKQPLNMYQMVEESLQTPRGAINFPRYINRSLSYGKFHNIECDHEPFLFDNKVNRIIKFCSRLLLDQTRFSENQKILQDVLFLLDEVADLPCTIQDIENVRLNSFFGEYADVIDSCKLIATQKLYSSNTYDLSQWCLLFPMEYIFEDFLAGFLDMHFSHLWKVEYQKSEMYLAKNSDGENVFNMQHDIFLTAISNEKARIIVDTKYKLRKKDITDLKKGVAQGDLYQLISYAVRRGCKEVVLVYPNTSEKIERPNKFTVTSGFKEQDQINVTVMEIPFWSLTSFDNLTPELHKTIERNLVPLSA